MSSLYIHIPFCTRKCPYCDFFSLVGNQSQIDEYLGLLLLNIQSVRNIYPDSSSFDSIYFGGGTPSLLSSEQIAQILTSIDHVFGINADCEITLEANPGTLERQQLKGYRQAGVNRLSIGVQSLDDQNLKILGRIHNAKEARKSVSLARQAGFDNLSLDLMFALPGETLEILSNELADILDLAPEHVSVYGLTFEEGTDFTAQLKRGSLIACDEDLYAAQYHLLHDQLADAGFEHYEISNFARPGLQCRHNQTYWQRNTCLAVGAGAHSFINQNWGERWHIPTDLKAYKNSLISNNNPAILLETFDLQGAMKEFVYLALRTRKGLDLNSFEQRFKQKPEQVFYQAINKVRPYLKADSRRWFFDPDGWLLYDHLISHFL